MTKYLRVKENYCGCISVQYFAILASCITLGTQLSFSIFFLIYGELLGLIPLFLTIGSHLFFTITISQFKSTACITIYTMIEIAFAFTILGFAVWILSWILYPETSFIYTFCVATLQYTNCYWQTQLDSLIWGCLFIIFFFVTVLMLPVYKNTKRNIKVTRKSSSVYITKDNASSPPVQPIFNINSAPTVPQSSGPSIIIPQQLMQQGVSHCTVTQQPTQGQSSYSQVSSIITPMGTIQLNLYTIQLPNGNGGGVLSSSPVVEQLNSNFSDSLSQTSQVLEKL